MLNNLNHSEPEEYRIKYKNIKMDFELTRQKRMEHVLVETEVIYVGALS